MIRSLPVETQGSLASAQERKIVHSLDAGWIVFGTEQDVNCLLTPTTVSREQQSLERVCEPRRWNATFADVHSKDS